MKLWLLALAIGVLLSGTACDQQGQSELKGYAARMLPWFEAVPINFEEQSSHLEQLKNIRPASPMFNAHGLLISSYQSLIIADAELGRLEDIEISRRRRVSNDENPFCGSVNSPSFTIACAQRSAAQEAFFAAERSWALTLATHCLKSDSTSSPVPESIIQRCLR